MRTRKAMHRAAHRSMGGHTQFVVRVGKLTTVFTLHDFALCPRAQIEVAYFAGRAVVPK